MGKSVLQTGSDRAIEFHWDQIDRKLTVNHTQDVQPTFDLMAAIRSEGKHDPKAAFHLFASLPNTIVYELKKRGIDIFRMKKDPAMRRRFFRYMHYEYPLLKATNKTHLV